MADFLGKDYENETLQIDGNRYTQCSFKSCKLIYSGGGVPLFEGCRLDFCNWVWDGAALRTIGFLRGINQGLGRGGQSVVEHILRHIETPLDKQSKHGGFMD